MFACEARIVVRQILTHSIAGNFSSKSHFLRDENICAGIFECSMASVVSQKGIGMEQWSTSARKFSGSNRTFAQPSSQGQRGVRQDPVDPQARDAARKGNLTLQT